MLALLGSMGFAVKHTEYRVLVIQGELFLIYIFFIGDKRVL